MRLYYSSPTLINCKFIENISNFDGAAIFCYSFGGSPETEKYSNPALINTHFIGNVSSRDGGAIHFRGECHSVFTNCSFVGNSAEGDGGAIHEDPVFRSVYTNLSNCSIAGNSAGVLGGGLNARMYNASNSILKNCIVWGNKDSTGTGKSAQITDGVSPCVTVNYSCIQDDNPDDSDIPFGGAVNNNIDDNPNFVRNPNDGGDGWGVGDNDDFGDIQLSYISPCIDAGDNTAVPADSTDIDGDGNVTEPTPLDLNGNPRFYNDQGTIDTGIGTPPIVDMGAYEFQGIIGDLEPDGDVDYDDLLILVNQWLQVPGSPSADIAPQPNGDNIVDFRDFALLAENWLIGSVP
jgi:hypothetical protein